MSLTDEFCKSKDLRDDDEWICKVAVTSEDRKNLIEAGFQFVEQVENQSYYKKRRTSLRKPSQF